MRLKKSSIIFITLLLFIKDGVSQSLFFREVQGTKALSGLSIQKVFEAGNGFIWVGTDKGLYKYNGTDLYTYPFTGTSVNAPVTAITEISPGKILVGYANGIIAIPEEGLLKEFLADARLPAKAITGFISDPEGRLWISTYGAGLYVYEDDQLIHFNTADGLSDMEIYSMTMDGNGKIFAGTDNGINICSIENGKKILQHISGKEGLPDNIVQVLRTCPKGNIWIGMQDKGICSLDPVSFKFNYSLNPAEWKSGPVHDVLFNHDGTLWIGTEEQGIIEINPENHSTVKVKAINNLSAQKILNFCRDAEGNIWIAGHKEGLLMVNRKIGFLKEVNGKKLGNISAVIADRKGNIWFGQKNMLCRIIPGREDFCEEIKLNKGENDGKDLIISLYEDKDGNIWIGTFGKGSYIYNPVSGDIKHLAEKDGLINNNVLSISGTQNEIWFATLGGVSKGVKSSGKNNGDSLFVFSNYDREQGPGSNYVYRVFVDSKQREWFATDGKGISVYDGNSFTTYTEENGLKSTVVYSIAEDKKGNIWFSTSNAGIYRFDGSDFTNFDLSSGLRDLNISGIAGDNSGNIVVVHTQGVDVINAETGNIIYYGEESGIKDINPDLNTICADRKGNLWIGTQQGMIRYCSQKEGLRDSPGLMIKNILLFLEKIQDKNEFSHKENHLAFELNSFWYRDPQSVLFSYKLEGYDLDWQNSREKLVAYANLNPGRYTFRAKASANYFFDKAEEQSFTFTIHPPFWMSYWFLVLMAGTTGILLYLFIKIREERALRLARIEKERLLFQFETLKSQINPHFIFNSFNALMTIIEEDQKLATEYVGRLSDFFRKILRYREKDLVTLKEELELVNDYFYMQKNRFEENLQVKISIEEEDLKSLIPPLTLQLLAENAIKHNIISKQKPLKFELFVMNERLVVRNNLQPKSTMEASTGFGLRNITERYRLFIKDEVIIKEKDNYFIVSLPIIKTGK